jgi:hypothetical protein
MAGCIRPEAVAAREPAGGSRASRVFCGFFALARDFFRTIPRDFL